MLIFYINIHRWVVPECFLKKSWYNSNIVVQCLLTTFRRVLSHGIRCYIFQYKFTDVSEEHAAFIFRVERKAKQVQAASRSRCVRETWFKYGPGRGPRETQWEQGEAYVCTYWLRVTTFSCPEHLDHYWVYCLPCSGPSESLNHIARAKTIQFVSNMSPGSCFKS
jgi:hypothetical protein